MRYTVRKSVIRVIGTIWMASVTAAQTYELSGHDVDNVRQHGDGKITRESVQAWLDTHAGDFSNVTDFEASIESGDDTIDIPWKSEASEFTYADCFPAEG